MEDMAAKPIIYLPSEGLPKQKTSSKTGLFTCRRTAYKLIDNGLSSILWIDRRYSFFLFGSVFLHFLEDTQQSAQILLCSDLPQNLSLYFFVIDK